VLSDQDQARWRLRIESAANRYHDAKLRVGETAIDRLTLPERDGSFAHREAIQEEIFALKAYSDLLVEYSRALFSEKVEP
jgi:hypothetical protein